MKYQSIGVETILYLVIMGSGTSELTTQAADILPTYPQLSKEPIS